MDKKLKSFDLVDKAQKRACLDFITALKPSEHEGKVIVCVYEHVVLTPRNVSAAYHAKLQDFAVRYRKTIERVSDHTGYTVGELCQELHRASEGFYWNDLPRPDEFHQAAKNRLNDGKTTTGMEEREFKAYRESAYRYINSICDGLDRWAAENFDC